MRERASRRQSCAAGGNARDGSKSAIAIAGDPSDGHWATHSPMVSITPDSMFDDGLAATARLTQ